MTDLAAVAAAAFGKKIRNRNDEPGVYVVRSIEAPSAFLGTDDPDDLALRAAVALDAAIDAQRVLS